MQEWRGAFFEGLTREKVRAYERIRRQTQQRRPPRRTPLLFLSASPRGLLVGVRQARLALFQSRLRRRQPRRQQPER